MSREGQGMTVGELADALARLPRDAEVFVSGESGPGYLWVEVDGVSTDIVTSS